jgi:hypothetical protein
LSRSSNRDPRTIRSHCRTLQTRFEVLTLQARQYRTSPRQRPSFLSTEDSRQRNRQPTPRRQQTPTTPAVLDGTPRLMALAGLCAASKKQSAAESKSQGSVQGDLEQLLMHWRRLTGLRLATAYLAATSSAAARVRRTLWCVLHLRKCSIHMLQIYRMFLHMLPWPASIADFRFKNLETSGLRTFEMLIRPQRFWVQRTQILPRAPERSDTGRWSSNARCVVSCRC